MARRLCGIRVPFQTPLKEGHVGCLSRARRINFVASRGREGLAVGEKGTRDHRRRLLFAEEREPFSSRPSFIGTVIFILSAMHRETRLCLRHYLRKLFNWRTKGVFRVWPEYIQRTRIAKAGFALHLSPRERVDEGGEGETVPFSNRNGSLIRD